MLARIALLLVAVQVGACARSAEPATPKTPTAPARAAPEAKRPTDGARAARSRPRREVEVRPRAASADGEVGRSDRAGEARAPLSPGSPADFAAAVSSARSKIDQLARGDTSGTTALAGAALSALADAIEAAPDKPERIGNLLAEVRFEAERLSRADPLSFDHARWMQAGLATAIDALEALPRGSARHMRPWLAAARRATDAIDADGFLSFQRPAVQDAFRAVVDGFAAAAQDCPREVASGHA